MPSVEAPQLGALPCGAPARPNCAHSKRTAAAGVIAGAGSSHDRPRSSARRRDHPRACGEQRRSCTSYVPSSGPSPRVRGAAELVGEGLDRGGTIPARAGSSTGRPTAAAPQRDHPRTCGEQTRPDMIPSISSGPSPRVRGAGHLRGAHVGGAGTACAGSRAVRSRSSRTTGDHPRACGEQRLRSWTGWRRRGPSPRVRGAGGRGGVRRHEPGTIPARAGSRSPSAARPRGRRDHPRACGEQTTSMYPGRRISGPSPRVRGAEQRPRRRRVRRGTIPARAGSRLFDLHLYSR